MEGKPAKQESQVVQAERDIIVTESTDLDAQLQSMPLIGMDELQKKVKKDNGLINTKISAASKNMSEQSD
jgi:hypothetical protein